MGEGLCEGPGRGGVWVRGCGRQLGVCRKGAL